MWSSYCYQAKIFIAKPQIAAPVVNLQLEIKQRVGGLMGLCQTEFTATIIFSKNQFYVGEQAQVRIVCDNSKCSKDIRCFKIKLLRNFQSRVVGENVSTSGTTYVAEKKFPSACKAGEKIDLVFSVLLPTSNTTR